MSDTVFILGAGFSADAKIPRQYDILKNVPQEIKEKRCYTEVRRLYREIYNRKGDLSIIPLEDSFTLIDRAISSGEEISGIPMNELIEKQWNLKRLVAMIIKDKLDSFIKTQSLESYYLFFKMLVEKRLSSEDDPFAIITLNWDTLPEYFISKILKEEGLEERIGIDYTCYDTPYKDIDIYKRHYPSISMKRSGLCNIKIQKLHGSLNWAYCSSCGRLFVKKYASSAPMIFENKKNYCTTCRSSKLRRLIIMPTFLKDLNSPPLKMVWHNALLDLQQANRIVFIGYSLPLADYEFRYILTKALAGSRGDKNIRVLLYPPHQYLKGETNKKKETLSYEKGLARERYKAFFSGCKIRFKYGETRSFIVNKKSVWDW
jgi:hypothetical protein